MTLTKVTVHQIGNDYEPVVVIDNFAPDPEMLRDDATTRIFSISDDHYPGVKAAMNQDYLAQQWPVLSAIFSEVFGISDRVSMLDISYALVTASPGSLALEQRLPHVDALKPGRLALVHYLVPGGCEGTAFYRHRSTGFESVDSSRSEVYFVRLNEDLQKYGQPQSSYLNGSTQIFEQTKCFSGDYNRALVYRGRVLHSGAIEAGGALSEDPRAGRLTVTGFFAAD